MLSNKYFGGILVGNCTLKVFWRNLQLFVKNRPESRDFQLCLKNMLARATFLVLVHVVPIRERRNCPKHNIPLQKTTDCLVEFVYLYPKDSNDNRRWIGGVVRCQKSPSKNLHNHTIHAASKITQHVKERISDAVAANSTLTPSDIACGKGLGFIPSAVDSASSYIVTQVRCPKRSEQPQCLKLVIIKVYKVDKVTCLKHMTAQERVALLYRSRSEEARKNAISKQNQRLKFISDPKCQYGPPNRAANFPTSSRK